MSVIREELSRLFTVEERHRRLFARLLLAFGATVVVFVVGAVLMWALEDGHKGGDIHGFGDAAFFAVQLLIVSSQIKNPVTSGGKVVDVALVTAVAGSFPTFFGSGDSSSSARFRRLAIAIGREREAREPGSRFTFQRANGAFTAVGAVPPLDHVEAVVSPWPCERPLIR